MNYYRLLLFVLLGSISQSLTAQNKVMLNISLEPGKTYKSEMSNVMDMEMFANVDSNTLATLNANGMKFPIHMHMTQDMAATTKTGSRQADKKIPATITYDKLSIHSLIGGQESVETANPFANAVIEGYTMGDYKINIDTIKGEMDEAMRTSLRQMVNNLQENIKYPQKEMKVGDSFDQEIPLNIPIPGVDFKMRLVIKYILKEIKDNKATFDLQQNIFMDMNKAGTDGQGNGKGAGTGTGTMVYNIDKKIAELSDSNIQFRFEFNISGMAMSANCKSNSKTVISVN